MACATYMSGVFFFYNLYYFLTWSLTEIYPEIFVGCNIYKYEIVLYPSVRSGSHAIALSVFDFLTERQRFKLQFKTFLEITGTSSLWIVNLWKWPKSRFSKFKSTFSPKPDVTGAIFEARFVFSLSDLLKHDFPHDRSVRILLKFVAQYYFFIRAESRLLSKTSLLRNVYTFLRKIKMIIERLGRGGISIAHA